MQIHLKTLYVQKPLTGLYVQAFSVTIHYNPSVVSSAITAVIQAIHVKTVMAKYSYKAATS